MLGLCVWKLCDRYDCNLSKGAKRSIVTVEREEQQYFKAVLGPSNSCISFFCYFVRTVSFVWHHPVGIYFVDFSYRSNRYVLYDG